MSTSPIAFRWERRFRDGNKEGVGDVQSVGTSTAIRDVNTEKVKELLKKGGPGKSSPYSDSLQAGWSWDRILVGDRIFRTSPDHPWGPPSLLYNGYRVFPGGKAAREWRWPPTPSSVEVKEREELYLYSTSGPSRPVIGWTLPLPLPLPLTLLLKKNKSLTLRKLSAR